MIESRDEFARNWAAEDVEELSEEPETTEINKSRRSFLWLQTLAFLLGLGLLIYVINRVGVQPLFDALLRIGFGFFVILGLSGLRHFLRTISMRAAVPAEHRRITFRQAFAARLGGEEFALLLAGVELEKAAAAAERLRTVLNGRRVDGVGTVTVSMGVASCPESATSERTLYSASDSALYVSKNSGRDRVSIAPPLQEKLPGV